MHLEDSLYATTYDAFKAAHYGTVSSNLAVSAKRFPLGANRDKFIFIGALSKLNEGNAEACVADLKTMLEKYPQSGLAEMAGMIVRGVGEGRRLHGGQFDIGNVWQRRSAVLNDSDKTTAAQLSDDRNANFVFMMAYPADSVDENRLLFELARYNFTSYMVRNFDINIDEDNGLHRMQVSGFRSYDEALQYARQLYAQTRVMKLVAKGRGIIISEQNLPLLGRQYSYDDYDKFYAKHFAPLKISTLQLLEEPDVITTEPDATPVPNADQQPASQPDGGTLILEDEKAQPNNEGTTIIPDEPTTVSPQEQGATVIPNEPTTVSPQEQGTTIIPDEPEVMKQPEETPKDTDTIIIPEEKPVPMGKPVPEEKPVSVEKVSSAEKPSVVEQPAPVVQPTPEQKPTPVSKPEQKIEKAPSLEEDFYFDDGTSPSSNANNKGKEQKENKADLEDEYYDLDGF